MSNASEAHARMMGLSMTFGASSVKLEPGEVLEEAFEVKSDPENEVVSVDAMASPVVSPARSPAHPRSRSPARSHRAASLPHDDPRLADLRAESAAAKELGVPWRERGPPPSSDRATWRGQKWREGSQRWANNSGTNKEWYSAFYKAKRGGSGAMQRFLDEHGDRFVRGAGSTGGPLELREWVASGRR